MRILSFLIAGLALLVVFSGTVSAEYEGDLTVLWTAGLSDNVNAVFVADLDNDGQKEVIAGTRDNKVYLLDSNGNTKWSKTVGSAVRCVCVADTDGDGIKEVIAGTDYQDLGKVYAFDINGNLQWTFQTGAKHYWPDNKLRVGIIIAGDVDNDGKEEVVVGSNHYYWFPSRICVLGENGNLEGEYWNTGFMYSIEIADLENDGSNEIIAGFVNNDYGHEGAVAVFDGKNVGGEGPAWVNGFNYNAGTQRWYWHSGVDYSNIKSIYAFDVDSDGDKEIACGSSDNRVYLLNSNGGVVWNYATAGTVYSVYAADIDDDGKGEILAGSSDKNVYCIEHTKSLNWKYQTGGSVIVPFAGDIDNDGASEIVAVSDKVYVLNSAGELKYSYSESGKAYVADLGTDGRKEVILGSGASVYALATTIIQLPDLTVSSHEISISVPGDGCQDSTESVDLTARVHNEGSGDANNVYIQFWSGTENDGDMIFEEYIGFMEANGFRDVTVVWSVNDLTNSVLVKVYTEPEEEAEENKNNNKAPKTFGNIGLISDFECVNQYTVGTTDCGSDHLVGTKQCAAVSGAEILSYWARGDDERDYPRLLTEANAENDLSNLVCRLCGYYGFNCMWNWGVPLVDLPSALLRYCHDDCNYNFEIRIWDDNWDVIKDEINKRRPLNYWANDHPAFRPDAHATPVSGYIEVAGCKYLVVCEQTGDKFLIKWHTHLLDRVILIRPPSSESLSILATCPIDLRVIDPEGMVVDKGTSQVPDAVYSEIDVNGDGDPDDQIIILERKIGNYKITVIPEPGAEPTDTYTLKVSSGDTTIVLAENVPISDIPDQPYIIRSTGEGIFQIISAAIPATVRIEPETLNLASQGVFTAFIQLPEGYDAADIDVSTVVCEGAPAVRGMVSEEDNGTYIAKFNRQDLINVTTGDEVTLTVTGELYDGTPFEGSDTIRVIDKGGKNK